MNRAVHRFLSRLFHRHQWERIGMCRRDDYEFGYRRFHVWKGAKICTLCGKQVHVTWTEEGTE